MGYITGTRKKRRKNKVAIVGFAPSTMADARFIFDDDDFEVWGLNQLYLAFNESKGVPNIADRADRWFQIHSRQSYDANVARDHSHHDWLANETRFPVYMQEKHPDIPMSVKFPKDKIMEEFGSYFTNSISWEIALAIQEGFKEIHLYGVDMATHSEYEYERPSVEFFLGWARGRGIKIIVPEKCDLLKTLWLYPYEDSAPFRTKCAARKQELSGRAGILNAQEQVAHDQRIQTVGKLDMMNELEEQFKKMNLGQFKDVQAFVENCFENFGHNRIKWREFVQQCATEEQGFRDNRMQVLGAADNIRYVEQTWENSARELATEKEILES
jgi:hypothetical protein